MVEDPDPEPAQEPAQGQVWLHQTLGEKWIDFDLKLFQDISI